MKLNLACASSSKESLEKVLDKLQVKPYIFSSISKFFTHFWHETNLSFETIQKVLQESKDVSWFLADDVQRSTSAEDFPSKIKIWEQRKTLTRCEVVALLNASFQEPGSLYVFDDYVKDSQSESGIVSGRELFFDAGNPVLEEMKHEKAIQPYESVAFFIQLQMAFRGTPPQNVIPLMRQIANDIETHGGWYSVKAISPTNLPFLDSRGDIFRFLGRWLPKADDRYSVFYASKREERSISSPTLTP